MSNIHDLPNEFIDLPSRGLIYPTDSPLSSGKVEIKIPTAKEEDILTNTAYLHKGIAVDKFLESIIVDKDIDLNEMIMGDKDAIQLAGRVLGYGKSYSFIYSNKIVTVDLTSMKENVLETGSFIPGTNDFPFTMPLGKVDVKFKILTSNDHKEMDAEVEGIRKAIPDYSADVSLLFAYCITEVNGSRQTKDIRDFAERITMQDSRAFRTHINKVAPGYIWKADAKVEATGEILEGLPVPYTADFFWPRY